MVSAILTCIGFYLLITGIRHILAVKRLKKRLEEGTMTWKDHQLYNAIKKRHNVP